MTQTITRRNNRPPQSRRHHRGLLLWIVALTALCAAAVLGTLAVLTWQDQAHTATLKAALESPTPFQVDPATVTPAPAPQVSELGPDTLASPAVDLRIPLVHLGLGDDGNFAIPTSDKASVFTDGAALDASEGSTFIAGHVVNKVGHFAPMAQLASLNAGDRVITTDDAGTRHDWIVTGSRVVTRAGLTASMWDRTGPRQLVLVTCAGEIDPTVGAVTQFTENLVVTAMPAPAGQ